MPASQRYLGIDPGLTATGWGVFGSEAGPYTHTTLHTISTGYSRVVSAE